MRIDARVIPVEGVSGVPDAVRELDEAEDRRQKNELLLLNIATGLAVALVSCAWVALALD